MAGRSRSSFNKRQKERSRQEKAREKFERKQQRKQEKQSGVPDNNSDFGHNDLSLVEFADDPSEEEGASNSNFEN